MVYMAVGKGSELISLAWFSKFCCKFSFIFLLEIVNAKDKQILLLVALIFVVQENQERINV